MTQIYYAKSKSADGYQPTVKEHLEKVSEYAAKYGAELGMEQQTKLAGLLHDFGKYSDAFQGVLKGTNEHCDHAVCGAAWLYFQLHKKDKGDRKLNRKFPSIFEASIGHHDGLQSFYVCNSSMRSNVEGQDVSINPGKKPALCGEDAYKAAWQEFKKDFSLNLKEIKAFQPTTEGGKEKQLEEMLYTRMIFSCLVDADYSVSASDNNKNYLTESECVAFQPDRILEKLYQHMEELRRDSQSDSVLNAMRDQVFKQCGEMGKCKEGLFTLTAPTGLGKTLAMLHFALQHCKENHKKRIIVVLPFLTLAEQNAKTYAEIMPDILVDHSQSDLSDEEREYAERWRFPFIITTSVNFFETLFAHRPGNCRKLHHIANSVVLFDEVQSLPPELTECTLHAVKELCERYHTTMVFSSATQPEFGILPEMKKIGWTPTEILPGNAALYQALQRTQVEWRMKQKTELSDIAAEMAQKNSVCAIVNLRKHARKLYQELSKQCKEGEAFFLTTDLCPQHRSETVKIIRQRLKDGKPCRVVATQCIEAGVDLDFEVLYRSLAPLDAIIQAAGRCNRNGRQPEKGKVIIFEPQEDDRLYPGIWYGNAAETVKVILRRHPIHIHDPEHIREYYRCIFEKDSDKRALIEAIENRSYEHVDREYKLIDDYGYKIIVPYGELYYEIRDQIKEHGMTPKLIHDAAPITVTTTVTKGQCIDDFAEPIYLKEKRPQTKQKSSYYVLLPQYEERYTADMGLQIPDNLILDACW